MTYQPETPSSTYRSDSAGSDPAGTYATDDSAFRPDPASTYPAEGSSGYPGGGAPSVVPDPALAYSDTPAPTPPDAGMYGNSDPSTSEVAKQQAAQVGDSAAQAGGQVAGVAKDQAANVAAEAKTQAKNLIGQTREELIGQAGQQQQRVASGLRSLGTELQQMASSSDQDGPATQAARKASEAISTAAGWLEDREPGQVMTEVQRFARQRPGMFLAMAAGAGLLAGRLTRGLTADSQNGSSSENRFSDGQTNSYGAVPDYETAPEYGTAAGYGTGTDYGTSSGYGAGVGTGAPAADPWRTGDPAPHSLTDPAGAGQGMGAPPASWEQDPTLPAGDGGYPDSGTGRVGQ